MKKSPIIILLVITVVIAWFYKAESFDAIKLKKEVSEQISNNKLQIKSIDGDEWDYVCTLAKDTISERNLYELGQYVDVLDPGEIPDTFSPNHNFHLVFLKNRRAIKYVSVKFPDINIQDKRYRLFAPEMAKCASHENAKWITKTNKAEPNVQLLLLGDK